MPDAHPAPRPAPRERPERDDDPGALPVAADACPACPAGAIAYAREDPTTGALVWDGVTPRCDRCGATFPERA